MRVAAPSGATSDRRATRNAFGRSAETSAVKDGRAQKLQPLGERRGLEDDRLPVVDALVDRQVARHARRGTRRR